MNKVISLGDTFYKVKNNEDDLKEREERKKARSNNTCDCSCDSISEAA